MTVSSLHKSTNVRIAQMLSRGVFRAGEVVAPSLTSRAAFRLWLTVPRRTGRGEFPSGGTPFSVTSQGGVVRGVSWGSGPVVYLVHGWGGHSRQLAGFVTPLTERGYRVVCFDAPSHGASGYGPSGPGRTHGIEFARALDEVAAKFGPADAVVAHSLGCVAALLAMRHGWLGSERLVFLAPMHTLAPYLDEFQATAGFGRRTRHRLDARIESVVGHPVAHFDLAGLAAGSDRPPLLVVHDRSDRQTSSDASAALVSGWPGATLKATDGLGHSRLLTDRGVVDSVVRFIAEEAVADVA